MGLFQNLGNAIRGATGDVGNFGKTIAAPIEGVYNLARGGAADIYGVARSALPGQTFQGNVQSFNRNVPAATFSETGLHALQSKGILPGRYTGSIVRGAESAGQLAVPVPGITSVKGLNSLSALPRLAGYSAIRAGEGAAYGGAQGLAQNGSFQQGLQGAKQGALFGVLANTIVSPRLTGQAVGQLVRGFQNYARNVADQPKINAVIPKLYAPVEKTKNRSDVSGKFTGPQDSGNTVRVFTEAGFNKALRSNQGIAGTIESHALLSNQAKVHVTFDGKGNITSVNPDRPEFAEYLQQAAGGSPTGLPQGNTSRYADLKIKELPQSRQLSMTGAQARVRQDPAQAALALKGEGVPTETAAWKAPDPTFNPQKYIDQQTAAQEAARGEPSFVQKVTQGIQAIKGQIVDKTAPIEDLLYHSQKQGGYEILPQHNISYQIDKVLRSPTLAGQFAKDNGLADVIKQAPDLKALDQYLIARQVGRVGENGIRTGRNAEADQQLIAHLAPQYEPLAQKVSVYSQRLLDYAAKTGLVSQKLAMELKQKYPDYVPLNRIFSETEQGTMRPPQGVGGKSLTSQGSQAVVKRLKGSDRAIESPIQSLLSKTNDAFQQGERNVAAQQLISYEKLPGNPFQLEKLRSSELSTGKSTVSAMIDGKKVTYKTSPEIASAAKNLDAQQLGLLGQILNVPVRLLRLGATGLNPAFTLANLAKDQVSAFINSDHALQTSIANPPNFLRALWGSLGHGELYQELVRQGAHGTSFDVGRNAVKETVGQIRAGRNLGSQILHTVTKPSELLRAAENIVGRTEDLTRIQVYKGTFDSLIRNGRTSEDAAILAAHQARSATVNFARSGSYGKVLNSTIPYLNAGIQGSRTFVRNLAQRPLQTTAKVAATVLFPAATIAAWNLSDPERKAAWDDIKPYEKQGNLIIIPEHPTKDAKGKWDVIKIPYSQEVANLGYLITRGMETAQGGSPISFKEMADGLINTGTSLDVSSQSTLLSQVVPQAIKPAVEAYTNTNLFTGNNIIPDSQQGLPPELQVGKNTSGTARVIGKILNISPRVVDNTIATSVGGLGKILVNASDKTLAATGVIPKEQAVGGQNIADAITLRFTRAQGGVATDQAFAATKQFTNDATWVSAARINVLMGALQSGSQQQVQQALMAIPFSARTADLKSAKEKLARQDLTGSALALSYLTPKQQRDFVQQNPQYAPALASLPSLFTATSPGSTSRIGATKSIGTGIKVPRASRGRGRLKAGRTIVGKSFRTPRPKTITISHVSRSPKLPKAPAGRIIRPTISRGVPRTHTSRSLRRRV